MRHNGEEWGSQSRRLATSHVTAHSPALMSAQEVEKGGLLDVIAGITQKCFTQGGSEMDFEHLQLPSNPFTFCLPDIQLAEVTRGLPTVAAPVLSNGPSASISAPPERPPSAAPPPPPSTIRPLHTRQHRSGTRADKSEHQQQQHSKHRMLVWPVERALGEPDASTGIVAPREGAQAFGLPHLIMHTSSEGVVRVQELVEVMEGMVASGRKKITERGCQAEVLVGVAGAAVLAGTMVPLNEFQELVLDMHIVVKGGRLEKAINLYTRMILSDAYAADAHADSTAVEMRTADVVAGDGGERVWSVGELRDGQVAFAAVVKAATVAKAPVCMNTVVRVVIPAREGSSAIMRVRRSYCFHFRDEHGVFSSYDPIPLHTLLFGMFFTKEEALAYASIFQGGQNSTDLQPAKETLLQELVDSEAVCDHEGVLESLLPLALHDGMTEALRDLHAACNGLGGRYTSLRSRAQIMTDVVTHFRTVLTRRSKTVARKAKSAPEQKDQFAALVPWIEIVQTSLQAIREELREATAMPSSAPPEGRRFPALLCSESLCLSAPLEWCMLALNHEHPELAGRRAGPEGMLEILEKHLKELVGLLLTLERTILWDVRRALYERERAQMTQARAASPQAPPTPAHTTSRIMGAQSAIEHYCRELERTEAQQGTTESAKGSKMWLLGLVGRRKPPRQVTRPAKSEAETMAAATAPYQPGGWVKALLDSVCKRCGGVCIDAAAEARRFAALHEPQTGADGRPQGPCKKLPQVISREAVLLSYVVDTRFDAVVSKFLEEAATGFVALPHVTAFARRVAQSAVWMELWTQPDAALAEQLAAAVVADIVKIAPAEGVPAPRQPDGYATMTDSKRQVFGTASALAWADTASVFHLLKEVEPLLTDPPLEAQAMSIFSSVALSGTSGDALLCLPRATTKSIGNAELRMPQPPASLITLHVIVHAVYSSHDQEAAALSHFAQFVLRKADTLSKEAPHILVLSLALGRRSDTWRGGQLQFSVEQLTGSAEAIKAAIRGSPRDVSVHCLMRVEGKGPSSSTTDTTQTATYQLCVIRMILLRQGPAGQGEEAVNPCLFDPGILHDTVFVDRKAAVRMSLFAQDTETHNDLPRGEIEARWRQDLLLRAAQADDAGDFFNIHKAYVKLIAADSSSEKFVRLMPSLARMMMSLASTLEGLVSTASALQVLLDEKVLSPVERAKIDQELLIRQAESFITSMALALVSPQQLHLHGEVQHLAVTLYRFYLFIARRFNHLEQSDAAPAVSIGRTGAAISADGHDSQGPLSVTDVFKSVSESYFVKRVVRKYADVDRKEPAKLLNELKEGLHNLKLAVARDVHDNCTDVEACVAQDVLPTS